MIATKYLISSTFYCIEAWTDGWLTKLIIAVTLPSTNEIKTPSLHCETIFLHKRKTLSKPF